MSSEKLSLFSTQKFLDFLHEFHSRLLWIERGSVSDGDANRENMDWLDGKRMVGFRLADEILNGCKIGVCYSLPRICFPYLDSISINEFKKIKAFLMWKLRYNSTSFSEDKTKSVYFEACSELEHGKINCQCHHDKDLPRDFIKYLADKTKNWHFSLIKRKAYWNYLTERSPDEMHNWIMAEKLVNAIYKPLEKADLITQAEMINVIKTIDDNHGMVSMFEYVMRCYLFKHHGLTRKHQRDVICCAKTGEIIKDISLQGTQTS